MNAGDVMDLSNQVFDENKARLKRRQCWGTFLIVIVSITLLGGWGYIQREVTAKKLGLSTVYEALHFYEDDVSDSDIVKVIYGESTALVISAIPTGYKMVYFYYNGEYWTFSGTRSWTTSIDNGSVIVDRTNRGHEWYVSVLIDVKPDGIEQDEISDFLETEFVQFGSDTMIRWYISRIDPTSSEYRISINGKTYKIELKGLD